MLGALILGLVTEVGGAYLASSYKQVIAVGILVLVLLFRPSGLFDARGQDGDLIDYIVSALTLVAIFAILALG